MKATESTQIIRRITQKAKDIFCFVENKTKPVSVVLK